MGNNTTTFNSTVVDDGFTREYAVFNYIMVGASCGILLIIIIIAKILCICNKSPDYEKVEFDNQRTLNADYFNAPEKGKTILKTVQNQNIPGEVYQDPLEDEFQIKRKTISDILDYDYSDNERYQNGVWHTPPVDDDNYYNRLDQLK